MMNRKQRAAGMMGVIALGGVLAVSLGLTGCSAEDEQPVVRQQAPAPPPPPQQQRPTVRPVEELKAELRIDERVRMEEDAAPATTEERRAILSFFDAFARGDHGALSRMLADLDRRELDRMVESGQWDRATRGIDDVWIFQTGNSPNGKAVLAVYFVDGADQAQLWYYTGSGDEFTFEAAPTPPGMASRLSGTDWIAAWHRILREEMELAMRPDQEFEQPQRTADTPAGQGTGPTGGAPTGPRGPTISPPSGPNRPSGPRPPTRRIPGGQPPG